MRAIIKGLGLTVLVALTLVAAQAVLAFLSTAYIIGMAILLPVTILLSVVTYRFQRRTIRRLRSEIAVLRHSMQVRYQPPEPVDVEYQLIDETPTSTLISAGLRPA